jgi:hypothetical protein
MRVRPLSAALAVLLLIGAAAFAQTPSPAPTPPPPPVAGAVPAAPTPHVPEGYVYSSEGRRDPFLSLLGTGGLDAGGPSRKGVSGVASMLVAEISVRGILQGKGGNLIAMVAGPDNKTYIVRQGDRFLDGRIKQITPQGLIIIQEVNDPLSLVKEREIRKLLRSLEDAKG